MSEQFGGSDFFGSGPTDLGPVSLPEWREFMHYLYLPVRLPLNDGGHSGEHIVLPERLAFLHDAVSIAVGNAIATTEHLGDPYVYVTARRGYATPGNPLNRPGWHCDDFGGTDLNYIWADASPTRFLESYAPLAIPGDDMASMEAMQKIAERGSDGVRSAWVTDGPVGHMLRLSPFVIHSAPEVPAPGGMRSFFKISVSTHRYDLIGNSHNHLLEYDWPMYSREELRNQPSGGNRDYSGIAPPSG